MNSNTITFTCWKNDPPLEIQLEPEALLFKVLPENEITFVGTSDAGDFRWALRITHEEKGIQLFPDLAGPFTIEIFENGVLLNDWHKYMGEY